MTAIPAMGLADPHSDPRKFVVITDPPGLADVREVEPGKFEIRITRDHSANGLDGTLGDVGMGELSPINTAAYATDRIRVRLVSVSGGIPPYRVTARWFSPPPGPGDLSGDAIGLGVRNINGCDPTINPIFDYPPDSAPKDADGIPIFQGSVGDLATSPPYTELFRNDCFFRGRRNNFTVEFAIGPQFFTPNPAVGIDILLTVELL